MIRVSGSRRERRGSTTSRAQPYYQPSVTLSVVNTSTRTASRCYAQPTRHLLVVTFQAVPGEALQYGALALPSLPVTVTVSDATRCALPGDSDLWPLISMACFEHAGSAVPVLCTARLFAAHHG